MNWAVIKSSDPEATAWARAAGVQLGLPRGESIRDDEFDGEGVHIRLILPMNGYIRIHRLAPAGFWTSRKRGDHHAWPRSNFWTIEVAADAEAQQLDISVKDGKPSSLLR
ncbi:hypothetical protein IAG25_39535 [Caballeronia sp. EK]|uniref:hypothetical protein n=2 Tax=unclassified Caballeronia TaxID=2646786 RepID=UPI0016554024|nr:hypothetical protein [Caballeronia sp. EK]MBC8642878.1 hypothetical protein [Caballeronia sp. EK]